MLCVFESLLQHTLHVTCVTVDSFLNSLNFESSICKMKTGQDFHFKISAAFKLIKLKYKYIWHIKVYNKLNYIK